MRSSPGSARLAAPPLAVALALAGCAADAAPDDGDRPRDPDPCGVAGIDPAAQRCAPSAGAPRWLEEGETVTATVGCASGAAPGPAGIEVSGLPAGATYDAGAGTIHFSPGLDQAAVYHICLAAPDDGERGELVIGVADAFDAAGNAPIADPEAYPLEYGLPVFFVSPAPSSSEAEEPVTIVYGGRTYHVEAKLRGATSLAYPKRSYTLAFFGDHLTDAARGLVDEKKIVLTTTFDDNAYLRGRLTWELWEALGPTVPVAAFSAVLYLGGVYQGVYTVSDHIDDELMAQHGRDENGDLFKAVGHDADLRVKDPPEAGYEKKHGEPADDFGALVELIEFVDRSDDDAFGDQLEARVVLPDFEAWWLLATFLALDDSAGKNSYLHHAAGDPWTVVPWDFNESLGQTWQTERRAPTPIDRYGAKNRLFERLQAHPAFAPDLAARYAVELGPGGAFERAAVEARIDRLAAELGPSIARDERRWAAEYRDYDRWSHRDDVLAAVDEIAYVRRWIGERWDALAAAYR